MKQEESNIDKRSVDYWSNIAEEYLIAQYRDVKEYPALKVRHNYILDLFDKDGKKVLDVGCGPGELIIDLLKRNCEVAGLDIASEMLNTARKNIANVFPNIACDLREGNIESLPYQDESFDAVVISGVVEYLNSDTNSLKELHRVLKKNGTLIVTVRNKNCLPRLIDTLIDPIKFRPAGLSFINFLRRLLGKKTKSSFTPYRKHSPAAYDQEIRNHGFIKEDFRYFHFYPFFVPFDKLFPATFIRLGLKMEQMTNTSYGWLASGYIVKARKI